MKLWKIVEINDLDRYGILTFYEIHTEDDSLIVRISDYRQALIIVAAHNEEVTEFRNKSI